MSHPQSEPSGHLPLTPVAFEILLALADKIHHGYGILLEIERRTGGAVRLRPGTLYRAINRLLESGLLAEVDERPDPDLDDERRRYYRITPLGREVAAAEASRLACVVETARARNLLGVRRA